MNCLKLNSRYDPAALLLLPAGGAVAERRTEGLACTRRSIPAKEHSMNGRSSLATASRARSTWNTHAGGQGHGTWPTEAHGFADLDFLDATLAPRRGDSNVPREGFDTGRKTG